MTPMPALRSRGSYPQTGAQPGSQTWSNPSHAKSWFHRNTAFLVDACKQHSPTGLPPVMHCINALQPPVAASVSQLVIALSHASSASRMHAGHGSSGPVSDTVVASTDGSLGSLGSLEAVPGMSVVLESTGVVSVGSVITGSLIVPSVVDEIVASATLSEIDASAPVETPSGGTHTPPEHTSVPRHSSSTHVHDCVPDVQPVGMHLSIEATHSWPASHVPSGLQSHAASPLRQLPTVGASVKHPATKIAAKHQQRMRGS